MKRILIYSNRKIDDIVWDISTKELHDKAKIELFKILNKDWDMYSDLKDRATMQIDVTCKSCKHVSKKTVPAPDDYERISYKEAKKGIMYHIDEMLDRVKHEEYGSWSEVELQK